MTGTKFTKKTGTLNQGKENEELNIAKLVLTLTLNDDVQDFQLSSSDPEFGLFDDIVCQGKTSSQKFKYAIQLKHINGFEKKLKVLDFQKKTGKFGVLTYCNNYLEVESSCETFDVILYTNRTLDWETTQDKFVINDGTDKFSVLMTECQAHPLLSTNEKNCCYKFQIVQDDNDTVAMDATKMTKYVKFFDKFYLYVDQMNVQQLWDHLFNKFKEEFGCNTDYHVKKYLHFIQNWNDCEKKKIKLNKSMMKNVLVFNLLSRKIRPPQLAKEPISEKMKTLRQAILKFDITVFSKENEDLVKTIWAFDTTEFLEDSNTQELVENYRFVTKNKTYLKLLWLRDEYPLLVVDSDITRKAISLSSTKKFILFGDNDNIDHFANLSVLRKLSDLEEHAEIYNTVVDTFKCAIQLKINAFPLRKFLQENKKIQEIVTTDKLVSMINGPLVICPDNEVLPPFYITRDISRNIIIDVRFFEKMDQDTLVFICCWKKNSKLLEGFRIVDVEELMKNDEHGEESGKVIYVSESKCSWEKFQECCSKMKKAKAHQFSMTEGEQLEWVRSRNGLEDLEGFREEQRSMKESELLKYENNINIVCAESGMGKTELMKSVKNKSCYKSWTIMIYARNHSQHFKEKKDDVNAFKEYIVDRIYKRYEEFELQFLKMLIIDAKSIVVRYIWDGLEELSCKNLEMILKVIEGLSREGSKHWITSWNNLKEKLEQRFNTFSWTIKEFDEDQQKKYIDDKLAHLSHNSKKTSENIIATIRSCSCDGVLGIPLLVYILTELFSVKSSGSRHEWLTDGSFSLAKLYHQFVEEKFYCYFKDRLGCNLNNEGQTKRNESRKNKRIVNYEKVAMKMYFEGDVVSKMDVDKFLNKIKSGSDDVGIITRVTETGSSVFLHSSFGEYFAGSYLARHDPHGDKFDLSDRNYKNIRLFRDLLVEQK
jgi:hypothetical protein